MTYASMPTLRDWMLKHPGWVTTTEIYRDILCPCPESLNPRSQTSTIGAALGRMAAMGVVERAPFDPMIFGDVKHPPTWMWCLTEEGKTHRFRTVTRVLPPVVRRPVHEKLDAGAMDRMLTVMQGRNPMLSATIAREMGCADSYMISGLLRRACKEGTVERTVRHGAAYFSLMKRR